MPENAISNDRADRIIHHLAECHREIVAAAEAEEIDTWMAADLVGILFDKAKDEINRRRAASSKEVQGDG
jgi:hypothetical protein